MDFYLDDETRMKWDSMITGGGSEARPLPRGRLHAALAGRRCEGHGPCGAAARQPGVPTHALHLPPFFLSPPAPVAETQLLETGADPEARCQVVRWLRTFPFAFISQREYVIARRFFREGDSLYAVTRGLVEHPAAPRVPGQVRMESFHRCAPRPAASWVVEGCWEGRWGRLPDSLGGMMRRAGLRTQHVAAPAPGQPAELHAACGSRLQILPLLPCRCPSRCSCWRSRTVPCPRGSGRPAVETTLLHFEDFRINERLARCAAARCVVACAHPLGCLLVLAHRGCLLQCCPGGAASSRASPELRLQLADACLVPPGGLTPRLAPPSRFAGLPCAPAWQALSRA